MLSFCGQQRYECQNQRAYLKTHQEYQYETILKYKNVSYHTQLWPMIATPTDAPNADMKQQIAQGHSQELKSSSLRSEVPKKQGPL